MHPLYIPAPYQDSAELGRLILRDGSTATVRVATVEDASAVADFFHRLSPESRHYRFFSLAEPSGELVRSLCDSSNPRSKLTLVITRKAGDRETIVAAGSYLAQPHRRASSRPGLLGRRCQNSRCTLTTSGATFKARAQD